MRCGLWCSRSGVRLRPRISNKLLGQCCRWEDQTSSSKEIEPRLQVDLIPWEVSWSRGEGGGGLKTFAAWGSLRNSELICLGRRPSKELSFN